MTGIRHIVFDVGKVLVHYDPHQAYYELLPDLEERAAFLRDVCTSDWNIEQDRGREWAEAEAEALARHPDKGDLIRAFRKNWHLMVSHEYPESVAIFRALVAKGHDVTLLTNFASDTFREAQRRFPVLTEGRGVTVSGNVKLIKPDRAIYAHHAEAFALDPAATLFFDDSPVNVAGAKSEGWNAELSQARRRCARILRGIASASERACPLPSHPPVGQVRLGTFSRKGRRLARDRERIGLRAHLPADFRP